jgi:16S rRNA (cytosine1402-N4)-methyltransferase
MLKNEERIHKSVLVEAVLRELAPLKDKKVIDATLGTGGHTLEIAKMGAEVLGIEADKEMLKIAESRLKKFSCPLVYGNFTQIERIAKESGFTDCDAVLFDLGVSNLQLTSEERGFSFTNPETALDMRIDPESQGVKGADLLNVLREDQLKDLFSRVLDYSSSRWLASRVMERREIAPITKVGDFIEITRGLKSKPGLNPATLPFLALRIAVNSELDNLSEVLPKAYFLLKVGGKLLVITFHSRETEIVKQFAIDYRGPIEPTEAEIAENPRSRSAKLFVFKKK